MRISKWHSSRRICFSVFWGQRACCGYDNRVFMRLCRLRGLEGVVIRPERGDRCQIRTYASCRKVSCCPFLDYEITFLQSKDRSAFSFPTLKGHGTTPKNQTGKDRWTTTPLCTALRKTVRLRSPFPTVPTVAAAAGYMRLKFSQNVMVDSTSRTR